MVYKSSVSRRAFASGLLSCLLFLAITLLARRGHGQAAAARLSLSQLLLFDDSYITDHLGPTQRFHYLALKNNETDSKESASNYVGIRDYFNFSNAFRPTRDYLDSVNIEELMLDELRAKEIAIARTTMDQWQYSDETELRDSGGLLANESRCLADLRLLHGQVVLAKANLTRLYERGLHNIELHKWLDAWGRPVSETYHGKTHWTGSHRACKWARVSREWTTADRKGDDNKSDKISFRYCWAKLAAKSWPANDELRPRSSYKAGVCLPDSCDTLVVNREPIKRLIGDILTFNFAPIHATRFNRLLDLYCLPDPSAMKFSQGAWIFIGLTGLWLTLILIVSLLYWWRAKDEDEAEVGGSCNNRGYHSSAPRRHLPVWLKSLSLQENYKRFLDEDEPPVGFRLDLRILGVWKLFAALLVCFAHAAVTMYWHFESTSVQNIAQMRPFYTSTNYTYKTLEIFAIISGMLTAFLTLSKFPTDKCGERVARLLEPKVYIAVNLARFMRILPIWFFSLAFVKWIFVQLGEGPYWDYGTYKYSLMGACKQTSWWRLLLLPIVLDFFKFGSDIYRHECIPSSWYIVTDMRIFFLVPLFIYLIKRAPNERDRLKLMLITLFISMAWQYKDLTLQRTVYFYQYFTYGVSAREQLLITLLDSGYFSVMYRFSAMAMGLMAGYHLYNYKVRATSAVSAIGNNRQQQLQPWPRAMRIAFWLSFAYQVGDIFTGIFIQWLHDKLGGYIPHEELIKLGILLRPRVDALTWCIILLRLTTDFSRPLMAHWRFWYKLSKLSYCFFFIHTPIIDYVLQADERIRPDSKSLQCFLVFTYTLVAGFLIAFPLYLLIESPPALLLAHLVKKHQAPQPWPLKSATTNEKLGKLKSS